MQTGNWPYPKLSYFVSFVCAAGSMPADLHKLWRTRDPKQFHLEYGNSCMGYEIPGAIGIRLADPGREVFAMVGDAGYLMNPGELVTAVAEGIKVIVVLVQNHGYASIGSLSEASGNGRFGTRFRYGADGGDGDVPPWTWRPTPPAWGPGS